MPPTSDQWLELHRRTLDFLRATIRGLGAEQLSRAEPGAGGEDEARCCGEPRPFSIAGLIRHVCDAECYWLREVGLRPEFEPPATDETDAAALDAVLGQVEKQYHQVLADEPDDPNILFGLSRVCQHNLYHGAHAAHLRALQEPGWTGPGAYESGSWEWAADHLTKMLLGG
jgi:hypothetical protein